MATETDLYKHAASELRRKGLIGKGQPLPGTLPDTYLSIVQLLERHAVKGEVPRHIVDTALRLITFQPLAPLTGGDDEWEYKSPGVEKNKRCPRVIRNNKSDAFDTEAVIYQDKTGHRYTTPSSVQPITFPYMPHMIIQEV